MKYKKHTTNFKTDKLDPSGAFLFKKSRITEKTYDSNKITFIVIPRANKQKITVVFQNLFNLEIKKVNIHNTPLKSIKGNKKVMKKAIITLDLISILRRQLGLESKEELYKICNLNASEIIKCLHFDDLNEIRQITQINLLLDKIAQAKDGITYDNNISVSRGDEQVFVENLNEEVNNA